MKKVVTIAGSDSSGGAGIQADIKTMMAHGVFAMSAITALTAQNTTGVYDVLEATPEFVGEQIGCIFNDIRPDAVKIGMVSNIGIIEKIAEKLKEHQAENIVVDPVMVSTSGCALMSPDAQETLVTKLLPLADIITPNIPETECLCGFEIKSTEDMVRAARMIGETLKAAYLLKAVILRKRPTICFMSMVNVSGTGANGWIIRIPMAPAVPFHRRSPAIWLWVMT